MGKRKKKKGKYDVFKAGLLLLVFSICLLFFIKIFKSNKNKYDNHQDTSKSEPIKNFNEKNDESTIWSKYENEEYFIKFDYPYLLHKVEYENSGDYDYFIVFEENQFSKEKGIAFGVSSDGLQSEVDRIKRSISKEGKSKLIKDEKIEFRNLPSWVLEYESDSESLENRSFYVIQNEDYTYSFSTVPEQIQRLIDSIKFADE